MSSAVEAISMRYQHRSIPGSVMHDRAVASRDHMRLHQKRSAAQSEDVPSLKKSRFPCVGLDNTLPTVSGLHPGLDTVSSSTLADVINGQYDNQICSYTIVDCRTPAEYAAGKIKGSVNVSNKGDLSGFFADTIEVKDPIDRHILIFYSEHSVNRASRLMHFMRDLDMKFNSDVFPLLYCPEMYILDGGYAAFYDQHKELCDPQAYKTQQSV